MCRQASGKSSLDNNFSIDEEVGSMRSGQSREDQLSIDDDDDDGALLAREGLHGQSIEYAPARQLYRLDCMGRALNMHQQNSCIGEIAWAEH